MLITWATTNHEIPKEIVQIQQKMTTEIAKTDYAHALEISLSSLGQYPRNFLLQTYFAMILGDYASQCESVLKQQMLEKSKSVFRKLMREVDAQPQNIKFYFKNEYYFRFAQYKEQYKNGVARVNAYWGTKDWLAKGVGYYPLGMGGYYSQGVGASNYAYELYRKGNKKLAQWYAQKALVAWAHYLPRHYNRYRFGDMFDFSSNSQTSFSTSSSCVGASDESCTPSSE